MFAQRTLGLSGGKHLQVASRKCIAKSCFEVQKTILEINAFSLSFYRKWIWAVLKRGKPFLFVTCEICDKIYQ